MKTDVMLAADDPLDSTSSAAASSGPGWPLESVAAPGRKIANLLRTARQLTAFTLITLGAALTKHRHARRVIYPEISRQVRRAGVDLLPMVSFLAFVLGLVVIGQAVALLSRVGAQGFAGSIMVSAVVRELGPMATALLVLARAGTACVVELGTARALGEVEALESLRIDPIHFLVLPRVLGFGFAVMALTVYFVLLALSGGYLFAFLQDVPLQPSVYLNQIAAALTWLDFVVLALKTICFGFLIGLITCFQGLAQPLQLSQVSNATTRAVVHSVVACVTLDALLLVPFLLA